MQKHRLLSMGLTIMAIIAVIPHPPAARAIGLASPESMASCELCLYQPDNMAFDVRGDIYLVDTDHKHRSRILKLSPAGKKLADWRVFTDGPGNHNGPNGIATDKDGNIYVPDGAAHRVLKLSPAGKVILTFGGTSAAFRGVDYVHVAVDSAGYLYATEANLDTILKFSPEGALSAVWHREHGSGPEQWRNPETISIGQGGTLVMDDWGNDRVEVLSSDTGKTLLTFRGAGAVNEGLISSSGTCTDRGGHIYVADYQRNRVKQYDSRGHLLMTIGDGKSPIFEVAPFSIACGSDGALYSADGLSVMKYSKDGKLLARWR